MLLFLSYVIIEADMSIGILLGGGGGKKSVCSIWRRGGVLQLYLQIGTLKKRQYHFY